MARYVLMTGISQYNRICFALGMKVENPDPTFDICINDHGLYIRYHVLFRINHQWMRAPFAHFPALRATKLTELDTAKWGMCSNPDTCSNSTLDHILAQVTRKIKCFDTELMDLPNEIMMNVLSFLPIKNLPSVRRVSRSMRGIVDTMLNLHAFVKIDMLHLHTLDSYISHYGPSTFPVSNVALIESRFKGTPDMIASISSYMYVKYPDHPMTHCFSRLDTRTEELRAMIIDHLMGREMSAESYRHHIIGITRNIILLKFAMGRQMFIRSLSLFHDDQKKRHEAFRALSSSSSSVGKEMEWWYELYGEEEALIFLESAEMSHLSNLCQSPSLSRLIWSNIRQYVKAKTPTSVFKVLPANTNTHDNACRVAFLAGLFNANVITSKQSTITRIMGMATSSDEVMKMAHLYNIDTSTQ